MNFSITIQDLAAMGISLPADTADRTLEEFNAELDERIGIAVAEMLDDEQLEQMTRLQKAGDDAALTQWLADALPDIAEIISDERDILLGEIADRADEF